MVILAGKPRYYHMLVFSLAFPLTFPRRDPLECDPARPLEGENRAPLNHCLGVGGRGQVLGQFKAGAGRQTGGVALPASCPRRKPGLLPDPCLLVLLS